jgi:hypothetical protein
LLAAVLGFVARARLRSRRSTEPVPAEAPEPQGAPAEVVEAEAILNGTNGVPLAIVEEGLATTKGAATRDH